MNRCLKLLAGGLLVTAFLVGCHDRGNPIVNGRAPAGSYRYEGYDSKGNSIVVGVISISFVDSVAVKGEWALEKNGPSDNIGPQIGAGLLTGMVDGRDVSINLNPGWVDNNVVLQGTFENDRLRGRWSWITFAGRTSEGTFDATKIL